ncbi:hypothetical protein ABVK25_008895 [Lepraria finkii]|uniref:WW domain-containing protein n=1 Tax=Lepraria finkii TaxID=1340010 RepID=A0ABR4AYT9_9LECA
MSASKPVNSNGMKSSSSRNEAAEASPDRGKEEHLHGKEEEPQGREAEKLAPETSHQISREASPLLNETAPPLPMEAPPVEDDGWDPIWDDNAQAYYFYNHFTKTSQWTNPRVPDAATAAPGVGNYDRIEKAPGTESPPPPQQTTQRPYGGYDPAIHGDYDPTAPYAQEQTAPEDSNGQPAGADPAAIYAATGVFNRFTGKWQPHTVNPENHNDENKTKRQMSAFFDVDAAANSHNGKSLKAERSGKKLSKQELKAFKEKRKEKKEEKRRAWLRD